MAGGGAQGVLAFGGVGPGGALNDTWVWDGTNWVAQSPATAPPVRYNTMLVYDASDAAFRLFGGNGGGGLSPLRSQPESGPVSQFRTNCLSKLGCTTPSW